MSYSADISTSLVPGIKLKASKAAATEKPEDLELALRAKAGDIDAYRQLVERYQRRVLAVAMGIIGRYEDAEDIVQEAFLKAFRKLSLFKGESSFYTWLYRIVFNLAIDEKRKRYRYVESSTGDAQALAQAAQASQEKGLGRNTLHVASAHPEEELQNARLRTRIKEAIDELNPVHRAVILLREFEGLSYAEISDLLGCSRGTVMSRLHHARKRLQKALSSRDEEIEVRIKNK
jgi:RNA polymerase sigma-70 factor, ECF subfamily